MKTVFRLSFSFLTKFPKAKIELQKETTTHAKSSQTNGITQTFMYKLTLLTSVYPMKTILIQSYCLLDQQALQL